MNALPAVAILALAAATAACIYWAAGVYNVLVSTRNAAREARALVDVQAQRRYDLVPNLVETVGGYASHERAIFERVARAREAALRSTTVGEQSRSDGELATALRGLLAVAEAYPALKASSNFQELQNELAATENRIAFARQAYNEAVMAYNTRLQVIPDCLVASLFAFRQMEFFEAEAHARKPVHVS